MTFLFKIIYNPILQSYIDATLYYSCYFIGFKSIRYIYLVVKSSIKKERVDNGFFGSNAQTSITYSLDSK